MSGLVTLLGAGSGNEELISVKGVRRLKEADVIVYDRLVNPSFLTYAKPNCELIDVGKMPKLHKVRQDEIEQILINKAKSGKQIVRLKSGDPYVFGRGGEEGITLRQNGVKFEVIPGITSAIAGLTYAGIPITYRDVATSFHVVTGHLQDENEYVDFEALAKLKGTLVFLMGMSNLELIVSELVKHGKHINTPVAIVEWGTHPNHRSIDGNLSNIVSLVEQHAFKAPSLIVVGEVVKFREYLNFYEELPLVNKRVLIQYSETGKLPIKLKDSGASVYTYPTRKKIKNVTFDLPQLDTIEGIVLTNKDSLEKLVNYLVTNRIDLRSLSHIKFVTVGHHTEHALNKMGILSYAVTYQDNLLDSVEINEKWLVLTEQNKDNSYFAAKNAQIITTHQSELSSPLIDTDFDKLDLICLPNSAAAENLVLLIKENHLNTLLDVPVVVMGEVTKQVVSNANFKTIIETPMPTILSVVETAENYFKN